jgi:ATP-dependent Clp endopeptidase proteolytic subunit ClpP
MLIDRHIGYDDADGYGIDGADFARELMMLDSMGKDCINVWINSPGGNVMDGYNIYNAILRSKTKVNTVCVGMAASISAVIFQAGRDRIMCDYGILMYHNPFGSENSDALKSFRDSIVKMISQRSGMSEDDTVNMMRRETFLNAQEAMEKKMCDRVDVSADFNKKRPAAVATNDATAYFKECKSVLNSIIPNKKTMDFSKIANRLKLNPSANEDAIIESITVIENRATKAEGDLVTVRNQITALETEKGTLTTQLTDMKNKQETAEKEAKKVKAQALIAAAVKLGTIKNEAELITKWTGKAEANYDLVKDILEDSPVNKPANKIVTDGSGKENQSVLEHQAAIEMAAIKNRLIGIK